jgi:hypothetical protein
VLRLLEHPDISGHLPHRDHQPVVADRHAHRVVNENDAIYNSAIEELAYYAFREATDLLWPRVWNEASTTKVKHCALLALVEVGLARYAYRLSGKSVEWVAGSQRQLEAKAKAVARSLRARIGELQHAASLRR